MMNQAKMYKIEVDEEVYDFMKSHAEPFKDTPNSVLRKYLPLKNGKAKNQNDDAREIFPKFPDSVPNALAQVLEMVILVKNEGLGRVEATHTVADLRGITSQAVIDKYCRQLDKRAFEVDELLMASNINEFKKLLIDRFPYHSKVIEGVFSEIKR